MRFYTNNPVSVLLGTAFLALSMAKYRLSGYTPRQAGDEADEDGPLYEWRTVERWMRAIERDQPGFDLLGADVLELGPGDSLGEGLLLHAIGAASYVGYDIHRLAARSSLGRYERLLGLFAAETGRDVSDLKRRLGEIFADPSRPDAAPLRFLATERFDFSEFPDRRFDVVVSNAAFEHFSDPCSVIARLTRICRPGALFHALIDLSTHSRWIRDHDPLSIYRLPDWLYQALAHTATPNRVRPAALVRALEVAGWRNIRVTRGKEADPAYVARVRKDVLPRFDDEWLGSLNVEVNARLP